MGRGGSRVWRVLVRPASQQVARDAISVILLGLVLHDANYDYSHTHFVPLRVTLFVLRIFVTTLLAASLLLLIDRFRRLLSACARLRARARRQTSGGML